MTNKRVRYTRYVCVPSKVTSWKPVEGMKLKLYLLTHSPTRETSGFPRDVVEAFALHGCYVA